MGAKETIREKSALGLFAPLANKHTVFPARSSIQNPRKVINLIKADNFRLTSDQNSISGNFYCIKIFAFKLQREGSGILSDMMVMPHDSCVNIIAKKRLCEKLSKGDATVKVLENSRHKFSLKNRTLSHFFILKF